MAGIIAKKWKTRQTETVNKKADEFFQKYWKTNERTNIMRNTTYSIDENMNLVENVTETVKLDAKDITRLLNIEKKHDDLRKAYDDMKAEKDLMTLFAVGFMIMLFMIIIIRFI